jgi:peptidoglycan hydrolase-like protein with peptidoglycan-binding domain
MSEEHDAWFKDAFGLDVGEAVAKIKDAAATVINEAKGVEAQVEGAVEGVINQVTGAAAGLVKKATGAAGASGPKTAAGGGTGSFPLGGSVGRGGTNAPNDVRAVQKALGITADGQCGGQTIAAIESFQRNHGLPKVDGRVDPRGATERAMSSGGSGARAAGASSASDGGSSGNLLDQIEDGAQGLFNQAKAGAAGLIDDAANLGKSALNAVENADLRADTSGNLNSPSYVNAQNPNPNLSGGGTASAGNSTFVTGQQKSTLLGKATAIRSAAKKLLDAEAAIESQKKGDKSAIDTAKNLKSVADAMYQVANAIDGVTGDDNAEVLKKGGKMLELGDKLIQAADTISQVSSANSKLEQFQTNPSKETAEAWARSVGGLFGGLSNLVPDVEPKFISNYWKGLLSAPSNYIEAFITMQNVYYGNIDKEAGLSQSRGIPGLRDLGLGGHAATKRVSDGSWEGDLTDIYAQGYFQPKLNDGKTFNDFMITHRKSEGMDLWDTDIRVGKAALLTAISRDVSDDEPAKQSWMMHVSKF